MSGGVETVVFRAVFYLAIAATSFWILIVSAPGKRSTSACVGAAGVITGLALLAGAAPAQRAARVDPTEALRAD